MLMITLKAELCKLSANGLFGVCAMYHQVQQQLMIASIRPSRRHRGRRQYRQRFAQLLTTKEREERTI